MKAVDGALRCCERLQGAPLARELLDDVRALRVLYMYDDVGHFDWLFSDVSLGEISDIRDQLKRENHFGLLERLLEHRRDVYDEEGRSVSTQEREARLDIWKHLLPERMWNDARLLAEAELVEADYFLTSDADFIKKATLLRPATAVMRPSEVPFVVPHL
jgi:hypothetical protein